MQTLDVKVTIQFYVTQKRLSQLYTTDVCLIQYGDHETKQDDPQSVPSRIVKNLERHTCRFYE